MILPGKPKVLSNGHGELPCPRLAQRSVTDSDRERILRMYGPPELPVARIARRLGLSLNQVRDVLKRAGSIK